jgi:hypothetical protein
MQLPGWLPALHKLVTLRAERNALVALRPAELGGLTTLRSLDVHANHTLRTCGGVRELSALTRLDLSANQVSVGVAPSRPALPSGAHTASPCLTRLGRHTLTHTRTHARLIGLSQSCAVKCVPRAQGLQRCTPA